MPNLTRASSYKADYDGKQGEPYVRAKGKCKSQLDFASTQLVQDAVRTGGRDVSGGGEGGGEEAYVRHHVHVICWLGLYSLNYESDIVDIIQQSHIVVVKFTEPKAREASAPMAAGTLNTTHTTPMAAGNMK